MFVKLLIELLIVYFSQQFTPCFSLNYVRSIVSTIVKVEGDAMNHTVLTPIYTLVGDVCKHSNNTHYSTMYIVHTLL